MSEGFPGFVLCNPNLPEGYDGQRCSKNTSQQNRHRAVDAVHSAVVPLLPLMGEKTEKCKYLWAEINTAKQERKKRKLKAIAKRIYIASDTQCNYSAITMNRKILSQTLKSSSPTQPELPQLYC